MLRKIRTRSVDGLDSLLNARVPFTALMATKAAVEAANNTTTAASTAAVVEIMAGFDSAITTTQAMIGALIDDTADTGTSVTWSVDKIKSYIASVDDSVVVGTITDRDNIPKPYNSLIAYVIDTTGDTSLGTKEGTSAAYMYVEGSGWQLLQILATEIDQSTFVLKTDIVDDLTTGGTDKPLSAAQGVVLDGKISAISGAVDTAIQVDTGLTVTGDTFNTAFTPKGSIIDSVAHVLVSPGVWDVVEVTAGTGAKEFNLIPEVANEYDGQTVRVSYLKLTSEV